MENHGEIMTLIQKFDLEKVLKVSDRGQICIVREQETRQRYIYRTFSGSAEVYRRICGIRCPYLPAIYAIKEENGLVSVLEEYVQGDTLAFLLEKKPLKPAQSKEIFLQVCQALEVLHGVGAVHRDIKPENIIIRGSDAVLIDFDASRICKAENATDTRIMGTTGYAAPEQYGFSQTDARADIYSMGVLLNEMLTRQHPSKRLAEGNMRPVIERCIEVNVDKRYASMAMLRSAVLNSEERWNSGKKRAVLAVAAAAVCLAGVLFGVWKKQEEEVMVGAVTVFEKQPVTISETSWQGTSGVYDTPFRYDLDGDGEMEDYRFGIYQADIPEGYRHSLSDSFGVAPGDTCQRSVYPCVWKCNADETVEMVLEFSELLTDEKVSVWRSANNDSQLPEAYSAKGYFDGGVQVLYTLENRGTWFYEIRATLGGHELTALAQSCVSGIMG